MPYKYNPLLKLDLQKQQDVPEPPQITIDDELSDTSENAVQNKVITAKITQMESDSRKKVSKFFTSIEELEIGEIGEYQGEPGGDFVPGYFYKRRSCYINELTPPEYTWNGAGYLDIINKNGDILSRQYARVISPDGYITFSQHQVITAWCAPNAHCFLFSPSFLIAANLPICNVNGYDYYIFPYAQVRPSANEYYFDFDNPVQYLGNNKVKYANNEPYTLSRAGYNFHAWIGAEINNPSVLHAWLGSTPFFSLLISSDFSKVAFDNVTPFIYGDYIYTGLSETVQITAQTSTLSSQQPFIRVDTQPPTDPTQFATAAQGAKADSALQEINHGTDGQFVTTTVTQKANNAQTIYTSLTFQGIATADAQHQGVAEASDVKKYFTTYIPYNPIYGIMWDRENPDPDCVRIGNLDLHATLPVHSQIVGGTLTDAGAFSPFADQSDWTGETRDGSVGQVMSRLPKFYYKFITEGTKCKVLFSADEVSSFQVFPMQYTSSYKATLQRSTSKLCSVVNLDADYRGGNNNADWDGTYRTLLGKPASNISLTNFRTYARNRNDGDTQWNAMVYMQRKMLYWLFAVEYATRNTQKAYNAALDSNGCRQGGLGVGVTDWNWNSWNAFNSHYPLIPCGYTDEYGNATAQKQYDLIAADGVSIAYTFQVPRYRGIESPFGDIWEWHDGILVSVQADAAGGKSQVYVTADPSKFSSTDFTQYDYVCDEIRSENFIKDIHFGDNGDIICTSTPGASTQYYCDWWYGAYLPSSGTSLRGVHFGGTTNDGTHAGLVYGASLNAPAYVNANIGSRLCYIPELT